MKGPHTMQRRTSLATLLAAATLAPTACSLTASTNAAAEFAHLRFMSIAPFASITHICTNAW